MTSPTSGTYVPPPSRSGCSTGKVGFHARRQAKAGRRKVSKAKGSLSIYGCPECGRFHLGHRPERVRNGEVDKAAWLETKARKA